MIGSLNLGGSNMNRRSRPIASEQAEVAKRDQNVSLGDVEETETSLWLHIYPAAVQRQALLTLMPALGCSDTTLRRDECGPSSQTSTATSTQSAARSTSPRSRAS